MSNYRHETVPRQFVEAEGIRYAYRRFGKAGTVPLLFLEYFNSNMDGRDLAVTNSSLAADDELILFDNAGRWSFGRSPNSGRNAWMDNRAESKKALVLEAFNTLFKKRDYDAAETFWSPGYTGGAKGSIDYLEFSRS
jgi:hypothetical protein